MTIMNISLWVLIGTICASLLFVLDKFLNLLDASYDEIDDEEIDYD